MINLDAIAVERLKNAAHDRAAVSGATHKFYRYPARFSPQFVRAFIEELTEPGDLVMDPFFGGGTTLVEAMLSGRNVIGSDINNLASFVASVKTTILNDDELQELRRWFVDVPSRLHVRHDADSHSNWEEAGYFRNLQDQDTWRYQKLLRIAVDQVQALSCDRTRNFARCVILRTAQIALDGKKNIPSVSSFRRNLEKYFDEMLADMEEIRRVSAELPRQGEVTIVKASAADLHRQEAVKSAGPPKLIITSPPYPGVHVLYHRWQVRGRRETSAPYWIANKLDGDGERYYTLGNRHQAGLTGYFENLEACFKSIASLCSPDTIVVQMVAFSEPDWQLPRYLEVMESCGLEESPLLETTADGRGSIDRIWREVPNRKWHAQMQKTRRASKEVLLVHQKR